MTSLAGRHTGSQIRLCAAQFHIGGPGTPSDSAIRPHPTPVAQSTMLSLAPASSWRPTQPPATRARRTARQQVRGMWGGAPVASGRRRRQAPGSGRRRRKGLAGSQSAAPTNQPHHLDRHGAWQLPRMVQLAARSSGSMSSSRRHQRRCHAELRWRRRWPPLPRPGSSRAPRSRCAACWWLAECCHAACACVLPRKPCSPHTAHLLLPSKQGNAVVKGGVCEPKANLPLALLGVVVSRSDRCLVCRTTTRSSRGWTGTSRKRSLSASTREWGAARPLAGCEPREVCARRRAQRAVEAAGARGRVS